MNKQKIVGLILAVAGLSAIWTACKKDRVIVNSNGADLYQTYMPLEIGKYIIYEVDSSIWDNSLCVKDSRKYQHKYLIADTFRDAQSRLSYVVNIYSRRNSTDVFRVDDVIYYTPGAEQMELMQKNIRFIRLISPVAEGKQWNGNRLIPSEDQDFDYLQNWDYTYTNFEKPFNTGAINFENTVTVVERDTILNNPETMPDAYAYLLQSKSVYAFRVGMVYHEYAYWIYDPIPGEKNCRKGVGVTLRAIEYN